MSYDLNLFDADLPMTDALTPATSRATLAVGEEQTARRVADLLTETLEDGEAAVAAFARSEGR
ncbi:MAG: hypothetical protein ABI146_03710, partial [Nitrobacter sp.]